MLGHTLAVIHERLPHLTLASKVCVEATLVSEGRILRSDRLAMFLGLPNRFALRRRLKRDGCPSLRRLAGWATVLSWTEECEKRGLSLAALAYRRQRNPGDCYRLVKSVTGLPWHDICALGGAWVELQLLREFGVDQSEHLEQLPSSLAKRRRTPLAAAPGCQPHE